MIDIYMIINDVLVSQAASFISSILIVSHVKSPNIQHETRNYACVAVRVCGLLWQRTPKWLVSLIWLE